MKKTLLALSALVTASQLHAGFAVTGSSYNITESATSIHGTALFSFQVTDYVGVQPDKNNNYFNITSIGSDVPFTSLAINTTTVGYYDPSVSHPSVAIGTYNVYVDWVLPHVSVGDTEYIKLEIDGKQYFSGSYKNVSGTGTTELDVVAVPEPGQALAGAVLLGCGALVFTGRRWIKSQSAK